MMRGCKQPVQQVLFLREARPFLPTGDGVGAWVSAFASPLGEAGGKQPAGIRTITELFL